MTAMMTIRRISIYADANLEKFMLEQCLTLGARGYSVLSCRGKGMHESLDDPFAGANRVKIEVLANATTAEKILAYLTDGKFKSKAVAVCVESVDVAAYEEF